MCVIHAGTDQPKGTSILGRFAHTLVVINMWWLFSIHMSNKLVQRKVYYLTCLIVNVWLLHQVCHLHVNISVQRLNINDVLGVWWWSLPLFEIILLAMVLMWVHLFICFVLYSVFAPASNISTSINSISMLNGTNFEEWRENVLIALRVMDLDLAIRIDQPTEVTEKSFSRSRRGTGKVGTIKPNKPNDNEACRSKSFSRHYVWRHCAG